MLYLGCECISCYGGREDFNLPSDSDKLAFHYRVTLHNRGADLLGGVRGDLPVPLPELVHLKPELSVLALDVALLRLEALPPTPLGRVLALKALQLYTTTMKAALITYSLSKRRLSHEAHWKEI